MCWLLILFVEALDHDVYISLQFALTQVQSPRQRLTPMRGNLILSCFHFNIDKQDFRLEYHWQFEICRTWELQFIIFSSIGIYFPFQRQTFFVVSLGSKMFKLSFREICYDTNYLLVLCCQEIICTLKPAFCAEQWSEAFFQFWVHISKWQKLKLSMLFLVECPVLSEGYLI